MPAMKSKVKVNGKVFRTFASADRGGYTVFDFKLKTDNGDINVSRFGDGVDEFLGQEVEFLATYNKKYDRYTVSGDVEALDGDGSEQEEPSEHAEEEVDDAPPPPKVAKKHRGRPKKSTTTSKASKVSSALDSDREAFRDEAVASVKKNLESALQLIDELDLDDKSVNTVDLADCIGRTITATKLGSRGR